MCAWNGERIKPKTKLIHKNAIWVVCFFIVYCLLLISLLCSEHSKGKDLRLCSLLLCTKSQDQYLAIHLVSKKLLKITWRVPKTSFWDQFPQCLCGVTLKSLRETLWTNPESWASVGTWEFITSSLVLCLYPNSVSVIERGALREGDTVG